ncbi:MAG TPA: hypothetical protein VFQ11_03455 [Nocardioidaceae bacterium]|jgi:hypothetical protein|nr:hypothetical protein [Nocardioidaceae bacterium]
MPTVLDQTPRISRQRLPDGSGGSPERRDHRDAVPDAQRAGALGLTDSVMVGAGLLGSLTAPWLSSALGPRGALLVLAAGSVATVALLGRSAAPGPVQVPQAARLPAQRTDGPAALLESEG